MEINKYKANIYADFTILSFHRPGIHITPQQPPFPHYTSLAPTLPKPHYPTRFSYGERLCVLYLFRILAKLWAHTLRHPCLACPSRCNNPCHSHSHLKRTSIPRPAPNSPEKTKKSAIRVNSGFFIFNFRYSSKWCPVVKQ